MNKLQSLWLAVPMLLLWTDAFAYIGPGMGGGVIAAIIGIIGTVFLALFAIIYYPIKRMLKKKKQEKSQGDEP